MSEPATVPAENTGFRMRKTVLWGVGVSFARQAGSILLGLVLARFISPSVFGQYATLAAIFGLLMSLSMDRFNESLFFEKDPSPADYQRHLGFGLILNTSLFVIANLIALSFTFSDRFRPLRPYLHLISISLLLHIPRTYCSNYLKFELNWRMFRLLEIGSLLAYALPALGLALIGHGMLALSMQQLMLPIPYIVFFLVADPKLKGLRFDFGGYATAIRFGLLRSASSILQVAYSTVESLVFSLAAGFQAYGHYTRARGFSQLMSGWISDQTAHIVFPAFAKFPPHTDPSRRAGGLLLRVAMWSSAPAATVCAMTAGILVPLLYGQQWVAAVPLVKPVLVYVVAVAVRLICDIIILTGEGAKKNLLIDALILVINLFVLSTLVWGNLQAFVVVLAGANTLIGIGLVTYVCVRKFIRTADAIRMALPSLVTAAIGLSIARLPAFRGLEEAHPFLAVGVAAALIAGSMGVACRVIDPHGASDLLGLLPGGKVVRRLLLMSN
jgi:O-antigen/teichoic acid export membrane protein